MFVLMLLISVFIIVLYSYSEENINIWGLDLKKADFKYYFDKNNLVIRENQTDFSGFKVINNTETATSDSANNKRVTDSSAQRVLLIGDSMVEGMMHVFASYCSENGHELFPVVWYSSSTKAYSEGNKFSHFISKYDASFVILVLGSNELFIRDIRKLEEQVKNVAAQGDSSGVKFVWIGPPNWKEDTGINKFIEKYMGKDRYFPSKNLQYSRVKDGAHPTRKSSEMWAEKIISWIKDESKYPIIFDKPPAEYNKKVNAVLMNYAK